jgi:hypothetical protein
MARKRWILISLTAVVAVVAVVILNQRPDPRPPGGTNGGTPPVIIFEPDKEKTGTLTDKKAPETLPKIDVVIDSIKAPSQVPPKKNFNFTIVVRNNNLGSQIAKAVTVEVRAAIELPLQATNLPVATWRFKNLRPGEPQTRKLSGRAPHQAGTWMLRARLINPEDYVDTGNNERETWLIVH